MTEPAPPPNASDPHEPMAPMHRGLAALISAGAWVVPLLLSRSTAPSPNHPLIWLWYRTLKKPGWKPPDIAIPLAWAGIESGLAAAAYRLLRSRRGPDRTTSLAWLAGNLVAIGSWSRLFFGARNLPASTIAAAAMVGTGAAYVASARKTDTPAAVAGVPLVAWVAFATVLTAALWRRNR